MKIKVKIEMELFYDIDQKNLSFQNIKSMVRSNLDFVLEDSKNLTTLAEDNFPATLDKDITCSDYKDNIFVYWRT